MTGVQTCALPISPSAPDATTLKCRGRTLPVARNSGDTSSSRITCVRTSAGGAAVAAAGPPPAATSADPASRPQPARHTDKNATAKNRATNEDVCIGRFCRNNRFACTLRHSGGLLPSTPRSKKASCQNSSSPTIPKTTALHLKNQADSAGATTCRPGMDMPVI